MAQGCGCMPEQLLLSNYQCFISLMSFLSNGKWELLEFRIFFCLFLRVYCSVGCALMRALGVDLNTHVPGFEILLMLNY